jgi:hypothetical protein
MSHEQALEIVVSNPSSHKKILSAVVQHRQSQYLGRRRREVGTEKEEKLVQKRKGR